MLQAARTVDGSTWLTFGHQEKQTVDSAPSAEANQVLKSGCPLGGRVSLCLDFTDVAVSGSISGQRSIVGMIWESTWVRWSAEASRELAAERVRSLDELYEAGVGATHPLACGVPDRESNETKYLRDALEMINDWQSRCSRRSSEGHSDEETTEVVLAERPQHSQVEP